MKTFLELFLRASRALPFLLLLLAFYDQSLRAQVPLPDVKFQDYRSQDVSPLLSEASNAATQSAYESIVDEKIRQVSQTWQQDAYQKIQTALLSINDSDTFNDVNAYRAHVEALLVAQKEEAWNGYWAALQNEVAQNRQTFAAALANKTLVSTQAGQTEDAKSALSISSNPANAWDTARSALDASHAKWQKEYLAKLEGGMQDYEAASAVLRMLRRTTIKESHRQMQNSEPGLQKFKQQRIVFAPVYLRRWMEWRQALPLLISSMRKTATHRRMHARQIDPNQLRPRWNCEA